MPSCPSYITKNRCGIFYFQYRVPTHFLRNGVRRKLFRLSLLTRDRREALKKARKWSIRMDDLATRFFKTPEAFGKAMELLMHYKGLDQSWESVEIFLMQLDEGEEHLLGDALAYDNIRQKSKNDLIKQNETLRRTIEMLQAGRVRDTNTTTETHYDGPRLSELVESYIKDLSVGWDAKHCAGNERDLRPRLETIVEIIGDKPCDALTLEDVARFKEVTLKLPSNRRKIKAYREKSIPELMQMEIPETDRLSTQSINKNLEKASSFLKWCKVNSSFVTQELWHPLSRRVKKDVPDDEQRDAFNGEDLQKLFLSEQYINGKHKQPSHYWIPLLALFTGARLNELCQLYKTDVYQDEESKIWVIDINEKSPDKKLKRNTHCRIVPIHPTLIKLGFIKFVESVKSQRLFNELKRKRDGYQDAFSKWFNRTYRSKKHCNVGNELGERKNFHSFRHTFINQLEKKQVPQPQIARLVGQTPSDGSVTTLRYGKKNDIESNCKIIKKLEFQINFDSIAKWRI